MAKDKQRQSADNSASDYQPPKRVIIIGLVIVVVLLSAVVFILTSIFPPFLLTPVVKQEDITLTEPTEDSKALIEIANYDWENGHQEKSLNMLREIIDNTEITDPNGLVAWAHVGMRLNSIGKYDETIDTYESLFQYIDPHFFKSGEAMRMLSHAYEARGRFPEMLWALRMGLKVADANKQIIVNELRQKRKKAYFGIYRIADESEALANPDEFIRAWRREKRDKYFLPRLPLIDGELVEKVEGLEQRINPVRFFLNEKGRRLLEVETAKEPDRKLAVLVNGSVAMILRLSAPLTRGVLTVPGPFKKEEVGVMESVFNPDKTFRPDEKDYELSYKFRAGEELKYRSDVRIKLPNPMRARMQEMKRSTLGKLVCTSIAEDGVANISFESKGGEMTMVADSLTGDKSSVISSFSFRITPRGRRISDENKDYLIISDIPYFPEGSVKLDDYWQDETIKWQTSPSADDLFEVAVAYIPIARQRIAGKDVLLFKLFLRLESPPKIIEGNAYCGFGFKKGSVASSPPQPIVAEDIERYNLTVDRGALVREVIFGTPAMKSGLQEGDVITEYDGVKLTDWSDLEKKVRSNKIVGKKVKMKVARGTERLVLTLVTGELVNSYSEGKQVMTGFGELKFAYDEGLLLSSLLRVKRITGQMLHHYRLSTELL